MTHSWPATPTTAKNSAGARCANKFEAVQTFEEHDRRLDHERHELRDCLGGQRVELAAEAEMDLAQFELSHTTVACDGTA